MGKVDERDEGRVFVDSPSGQLWTCRCQTKTTRPVNQHPYEERETKHFHRPGLAIIYNRRHRSNVSQSKAVVEL